MISTAVQRRRELESIQGRPSRGERSKSASSVEGFRESKTSEDIHRAAVWYDEMNHKADAASPREFRSRSTRMGISDFIGGRGEAIAFMRLSKICRVDANLPYFWPHFLGEKCETFDFLVELIDAGDQTPFFFVQVKTTRKKMTATQVPPRLRIQVSKKDIRRMVSYPAPTYVVGVHEDEERAFIVSVHGTMSDAMPSMTTAHELTSDTLQKLWDEVRAFWQSYQMAQPSSSFLN